MKQFQKIRLSSRDLSVQEVMEAAMGFAQESDGWLPHPEFVSTKSVTEKYSLVCLEPPIAVVALAEEYSNRKSVQVANIVPRDVSCLKIAEHNQIAQRFVTDFKRYCRGRIPIKITITPEDCGLETAISGKTCRKYFNNFLNHHPLSHHAYDVERLDVFICSVHRYRSYCNEDTIMHYLQSDLGWKKQDAQLVRDRIRIGLEVLRVNQRF